MKKCLNCGYERQPKDEGIIPTTECPKCGIIYSKMTPPVNEEAHLSREPKPVAGAVRGGILKAKYIVIIVLICACGIYLITAKSPQEKLDSKLAEWMAAVDSLNRFEELKRGVESGEIT